MSEGALYLTEADVAKLVDLNDAIEAVELALRRDARGGALNIPKALGVFPGPGSLHALGAAFPSAGWGAFKTWINTPAGAQAVLQLFDTTKGRLAGILEAGILGQLRTAAISGVATRFLAPQGADDFTLIGAGRQALMQLAAVAAVRPLRRVRVYSRTSERREAFAAQATALFPFKVEASPTLENALEGAPVVTLVTRAAAPFVSAGAFAPGAHINAVGAILPGHAEFTQDVFDQADLLVVDSLAAVQQNSQEFIDRFGRDGPGWADVQRLGVLLEDGLPPRRPGGLSLFKAMGMGISDLAVACMAWERAVADGAGASLPGPTPAKPRWRTPSIQN